jgi:hypothetical protein
MPRLKRDRPSLLTRTTALLGILMVLALTVLAASPDLHERLHAHEAAVPGAAAHPDAAADDDGGCVVTLFAQGIIAALLFLSLAFTGQRVRFLSFAGFDRVLPAAPPYLFLPTQAPPAGRL